MNIFKKIVAGVKKLIGKIKRRKPTPAPAPVDPAPVPVPPTGPVPVDREKFGVTWDIIDKARIRALRYSDLSPWERRYFNTEEKKTRISGGSPQQWVQDFWADHLYAEMYPEGEAEWNAENSKLIIWVIRTSTTDDRVFGVDSDGNWGWGYKTEV